MTIDGQTRPLSSLRRVALGREWVVQTASDGSTANVLRGVTVALVFEHEAVVVGRASTVDAASTVAAHLATPADLSVDWLADTFSGVAIGPSMGGLQDRGANSSLLWTSLDAAQADEHQHRVTPRYGTHASMAARMTTALLGLFLCLAVPAGVLSIELSDRAELSQGRWLCAAAAVAMWALADLVMLVVCAAILRGAAIARAREEYGLPAR